MNEHSSKTLRILVVDDCTDVRESIGMLLRSWGHDVHGVGDGYACLTTAENYLPHVVLLDVGLPDMDGYEVARRLCTPPRMPAPHLVTISGHGLDEDFHRSRSAGCDRHMVKPVDLLDLQRMLARYAEQVREEPSGAVAVT